jgi:hypothetical protein
LFAILDDMDPLPPGLWLVKWIDLFELGPMCSPRVGVLFQRLSKKEVADYERLSQEEVGYLLGRAPDDHIDWFALTRKHKVMVGSLPLLKMGDIVRETRIVGKLRQRERTITLTDRVVLRREKVDDVRQPAPDGWSRSYRHKVLNWFEYELKDVIPEGSWCSCMDIDGIEVLIPDSVVFKTFYGFHTKVGNAFCEGAWDVTYRNVISTAKPDNGLGTFVDEQTGAWNIVVRHPLTREHALRLAPLRFDEYALSRARAIHSKSLEQTRQTRSGEVRQWHMEAEIPYRWDATPLTMRVRGFPLRPFDLSPPRRSTRFLVTSIDATSWPYVDQLIATEAEYSPSRSDDPNPEKVDRPFKSWTPAPVPAAPDAQLSQTTDPRSTSALNHFHADEFEFLTAPQHIKQTKRSHKEYRGHSGPAPEPPDAELSAGIPAPGKHRPGQLVAETKEPRHLPSLRFLLNALSSLAEDGRITGYEVVSPPEKSHLRQYRDDTACWSLLGEKQAERLGSGNQRGARGWEYMFRSGPGGRRQAYARCVLILLIHRDNRQILFFEIESRHADRYWSYACELTKPASAISIASVLGALRSYEGRLPENRLGELFQEVTGERPRALKHRYVRDKTGQPTGLNVDWLLSRLDLVLFGG